MSRANGTSLDKIIFSGEKTAAEYMDKLVALQVQMHAIRADRALLPAKTEIFRKNIFYNPRFSDTEKQQLLKQLETMPDGDSLCYGDLHIGNVLLDADAYTIIDWAEVSSRPAAADACRTYLDYTYLGKMVPQPGVTEAARYLGELFLEKYTAASGMPREEILAWLPINAVALCGFIQDDGMNKELYALATRE